MLIATIFRPLYVIDSQLNYPVYLFVIIKVYFEYVISRKTIILSKGIVNGFIVILP